MLATGTSLRLSSGVATGSVVFVTDVSQMVEIQRMEAVVVLLDTVIPWLKRLGMLLGKNRRNQFARPGRFLVGGLGRG